MKRLLIISLNLLFCTSAMAAYSLKSGKLVEQSQAATTPVQDHFRNIREAYDKEDWNRVVKESLIVVKNFDGTSFAKEATYFLGAGYYHQEEYEMANNQLTDYLTKQAAPKYFEEAIQIKFEIAEKFRTGSRKHMMGLTSLPKWMPAGGEAISIYDEVISALPHHDLAAHALYGKAQLLSKREDFRASIECYQTLIRRFAKHSLAVEAYLGIGEIYYNQSMTEYPDPDYLDLAELNLRKFRNAFPREEKIATAEQGFAKMREHYAENLYETAKFYERTGKFGAAKIYYQKIIASYPHTKTAELTKTRLNVVETRLAKINQRKAKAKKK